MTQSQLHIQMPGDPIRTRIISFEVDDRLFKAFEEAAHFYGFTWKDALLHHMREHVSGFTAIEGQEPRSGAV